MTTLRELALDEKGVRRVRTPAGVRYFGLPIGSIITRDARDRAKARHKAKRAKPRSESHTKPQRPQRGKGKPRSAGSSGGSKKPIKTGDRVFVSTGEVGTVVRKERKNNMDGHIVDLPDGKQRWVQNALLSHATDEDERHAYGGNKKGREKLGMLTSGPVDPPKTKTGPIEDGDRVVAGGSIGTVIRKERKYRQDGLVIQFPNPDNPNWGSYPRWVPANQVRHASDDDEKKITGGRKRNEYLRELAEEGKKKREAEEAAKATAFKPKKRAPGVYTLNGKQHRIMKADTDYGDVNLVRDKKTGTVFVVQNGKPTRRYDKNGLTTHLENTLNREYAKADLEEFDASDKPKLDDLGDKPVPKKPATKKVAVQPSADALDHIQEMRDFHDRGFGHFDELVGTESNAVSTSNVLADRFDRRVKRYNDIIEIENDLIDQHERGDRSDDRLPPALQNELDDIERTMDRDRAEIEDLVRLAELGRPVKASDIGKPTEDSVLVNIAAASNVPANGTAKATKQEIADYLNKVNTKAPVRDKNGRSIPSEGIMDSRDDFVDVGKTIQKDMARIMDGDPDVIAARKKYDDIDGDDPHPPNFRELNPNWRKLSQDRLRTLLMQAQHQENEWLKRRGLVSHDRSYEESQKRRDFLEKRNAQILEAERDLAKAERKVKLDYLSKIRPMGPTDESMPAFRDFTAVKDFHGKQLSGEETGSAELFDQTVRDAMAIYPTSWIASIPDNHYQRAWSTRAFQSNRKNPGDDLSGDDDRFDANSILALDHPGHRTDFNNTSAFGNGPDDKMAYNKEVAAHEVGHIMEVAIPGIAAMEWGELYDRAGRKRPDGTWEGVRTPQYYDKSELMMDDQFLNEYAGKTYSVHKRDDGSTTEFGDLHKRHWELFTTGVQDVFGRSSRGKKFTHADDKNVEALILGLMATMHYMEDEEGWRK